ncbi:MAG TPA: type II toxin-antitoxin system RelE/ParE family toxin, partial [Candidatus Saccharimonadales bacterium]|nr:type II toxin-antitoxin system RelE/ParE family toxin [Candidatus Saccharimonadales bacterium]
RKLDTVAQKQIVKKLRFFMEQPDPLQFATSLVNFTKAGSYRFRVGKYRIVFDVADNIIFVLHIEHRRDVYRRT